MTSSERNIILFQAVRAILQDLPQTNEVTRAREGLTLAIEELTMEEE